jgi:hypothetical protein
MNFAFYIVNATHLKLVEIDQSLQQVSGEAFQQTGTQSNAVLTGPYAYTLAGGSPGGPFAAGGVFTSDGNGNISSGVQDINDDGGITLGASASGTYSIDSTGRGIMTLTGGGSNSVTNLVFYPSSGGLQMLETDSLAVSSGVGYSQSSTSFSNSAFQGAYALNLGGVVINGGELDAIAQMTADGNGNLNGTMDVNNSGGLTNQLLLSGTYSVSANGRATGTIKSSTTGTMNFVYYVVSPTRVLGVEVDRGQVSIADAEHQ